MKKLILIIAMFVVGSFCAEAQTITEYNQKAISNQSLTYDEYWNPIAQFTLKNLSNKTITNVEIVIYYNGYRSGDIFQPTTTCRTSTTIYPGAYGQLRFTFNCGYKRPQSFVITRIRYADGTVCQADYDYY